MVDSPAAYAGVFGEGSCVGVCHQSYEATLPGGVRALSGMSGSGDYDGSGDEETKTDAEREVSADMHRGVG